MPLPGWKETDVRVLSSPRMGAEFVQMLLDVKPGGSGERPSDGRVENFLYLLQGEVELRLGTAKHSLGEGGYALLPHTSGFAVKSATGAKVIWVQKAYEIGGGDRSREKRSSPTSPTFLPSTTWATRKRNYRR